MKPRVDNPLAIKATWRSFETPTRRPAPNTARLSSLSSLVLGAHDDGLATALAEHVGVERCEIRLPDADELAVGDAGVGERPEKVEHGPHANLLRRREAGA